jgi:hypothetical protein
MGLLHHELVGGVKVEVLGMEGLQIGLSLD